MRGSRWAGKRSLSPLGTQLCACGRDRMGRSNCALENQGEGKLYTDLVQWRDAQFIVCPCSFDQCVCERKPVRESCRLIGSVTHVKF